MKLLSFASAFTLALTALPAQAALLDGSFEAQGAAAIGGQGYCYFGGPFQCAGPNTPWDGTAGLQLDTNGGFPGTDTPDGSYYGFVQGGSTLFQSFTADTSGTFNLKWIDAGRNNGSFPGNESYSVLIDAATVYTGATTTGQPFTARTSGTFSLVAGQTYTVKFQGLTNSDQTAFIDSVSLSAVPESATWMQMILGFGVIGGALRSARRARVLAAA